MRDVRSRKVVGQIASQSNERPVLIAFSYWQTTETMYSRTDNRYFKGAWFAFRASA